MANALITLRGLATDGTGSSFPNAVQLLRSPTTPGPFPSAITNGLASGDPATQREALRQLQSFIDQLFFMKLSGHFLVSLVVTSSLILLLLAIGLLVVLHRIAHKRFSIFRIERRIQGLYIVPNAINCFLLFEGIYAIIMCGFNFTTWRLFGYRQAIYVHQFQAWRSLCWIPLYIGAFLTGWGSFYTAPGALDKPSASHSRSNGKGRMPWPTVVNLCCIGTPFVLVASLVPFVVLSQRQMTSAFGRYQTWDAELNSLLTTTVITTVLPPTTIDTYQRQAHDIWQSWSKSYWYNDVSYALWSFWALFFLFFYIPAGGVLVFLLYRQVRRQKAVMLSYRRKLGLQCAQGQAPNIVSQEKDQNDQQDQTHFDVQDQAQGHSHNAVILHSISEDRENSKDSGHTGSSANPTAGRDRQEHGLLRHSPSQTTQHFSEPRFDKPTALAGQAHGELSSTAVAEEGLSSPVSPVSARTNSVLKRLSKTDSHGTNGGKTVELPKQPGLKTISFSGSTTMLRYKHLRRCLVNLMILYFGIIVAACFFLVCTLLLAASEYERTLQGPEQVGALVEVAGLLAAWASCIFGAITIGSIIFRNFDNPQPVAGVDSGNDAPKRHKFYRHSKDAADAAASQHGDGPMGFTQHEKSRTLPAVPESVDLEASMMSMTRSRLREPMPVAMKFSLSPQSGRRGALVFQPDDQLASTVSANTPEMEEANDQESVARASRAKPGLFGKIKPSKGPNDPLPSFAREREASNSVPQDEMESFGLSTGVQGLHMPVQQDQGSPEAEQEAKSTLGTYAGTLVSPGKIETGVTKQVENRLAVSSSEPRKSTFSAQSAADSPSPSTILKRHSRLSDSTACDTPSSKIAREWALSQYLRTPLPHPPSPTPGEQASADVNVASSSSHPNTLQLGGVVEAAPAVPSARSARSPKQQRWPSQAGESTRPSNRISPGTFF